MLYSRSIAVIRLSFFSEIIIIIVCYVTFYLFICRSCNIPKNRETGPLLTGTVHPTQSQAERLSRAKIRDQSYGNIHTRIIHKDILP